MKRLITLFATAVFLCPVVASSQTTPSIVGELNWTLNPPLSTGTQNWYPPGIQGNCGTQLTCTTQHPPWPAPSYTTCTTPEYFTCTVTGSGSVSQITVSATTSGTNSYSLTGLAVISLAETYPFFLMTQQQFAPGYGSMILSGNQYFMMLTFGAGYGTMNCTLSSSTLSGTCIGSFGEGRCDCRAAR